MEKPERSDFVLGARRCQSGESKEPNQTVIASYSSLFHIAFSKLNNHEKIESYLLLDIFENKFLYSQIQH